MDWGNGDLRIVPLPRIIAFLDFCLIEGMRHVGFELKNETNFDSNVLLSFKKAPTRLLTHTPKICFIILNLLKNFGSNEYYLLNRKVPTLVNYSFGNS